MQLLADWRRHEAKCFAYELEVYAEYTERELVWHARRQYWAQQCTNLVRPLFVWWYRKKADRAFERWQSNKTFSNLKVWLVSELRVCFAEGVRDMHFSFDPEKVEKGELTHERQLLGKAGALRSVRLAKQSGELRRVNVN
jgi:hypothetical protein